MKISQKKTISIVCPVYNEEEIISKFYNRLVNVLKGTSYNYEIIFVDDGSSDQTLNILSKIAENDTNIKIIIFSRNFGHMIALSAGLDYAAADAAITMDTDLQHPPELIPELLKKWEEGSEVVNTIREETKGSGIFKKMTANLFYWLMNRIAKVNFRSNSADFRLLDRAVVETIKKLKEHSRFLRGLISWAGFRQEYISYQSSPRLSGKTKYSLLRMISFAIDGITSFSAFPLRISTYAGLVIAFLSSIYIAYAIYMHLLHKTILGWTSVLVVVLFMGGIQLIFLGIIGEYLARVYEETKERPLYVVKNKIGF